MAVLFRTGFGLFTRCSIPEGNSSASIGSG
eukprot:COSAG04_NODE_32433_length_251_cov_0.677632_1_plen_29_part_10